MRQEKENPSVQLLPLRPPPKAKGGSCLGDPEEPKCLAEMRARPFQLHRRTATCFFKYLTKTFKVSRVIFVYCRRRGLFRCWNRIPEPSAPQRPEKPPHAILMTAPSRKQGEQSQDLGKAYRRGLVRSHQGTEALD